MDTATVDIQASQPWSLQFTDAIFQADETHCGLERQVQDWSEWLDMHGLRLNIKKTENMKCGPQTDGMIRVRGQPQNKVTEFRYFASLFRSDSNSLRDACANTGWLRAFSLTAKLEDFSGPKTHI